MTGRFSIFLALLIIPVFASNVITIENTSGYKLNFKTQKIEIENNKNQEVGITNQIDLTFKTDDKKFIAAQYTIKGPFKGTLKLLKDGSVIDTLENSTDKITITKSETDLGIANTPKK